MKKVAMLLVVMLVAGGLVYGQAFKVTSVGGYLGIHGLLGPTGATEVISKGGSGMGFGPFLGVGGKVKASMASMPKIEWTGRVGYDIFQGKGGTPEKTNTEGLLGIGLGAQYGLKPMMMGSKELRPYVGGELQINMFMPSSEGYVPAQTKNTGTRVGLGLGGGVDYPLNEKLSLDVGLKLSIANLIGKGSAAADIVAYDAAPATTQTEGTWMHLSLNVGVNFSLGAATGGM